MSIQFNKIFKRLHFSIRTTLEIEKISYTIFQNCRTLALASVALYTCAMLNYLSLLPGNFLHSHSPSYLNQLQVIFNNLFILRYVLIDKKYIYNKAASSRSLFPRKSLRIFRFFSWSYRFQELEFPIIEACQIVVVVCFYNINTHF